MSRRLRPATRTQETQAKLALAHLQLARDLLKAADCPQTLARVRKAITSCGGALRHVDHRRMRS